MLTVCVTYSVDPPPGRPLRWPPWRRLQIRGITDGSAIDDAGTVEFVAHYWDVARRRYGRQHENSRFSRQEGRWFYVEPTSLPRRAMIEPRMIVRERRDADLEALVELLARTHHDRGYPVDITLVRADFIASCRGTPRQSRSRTSRCP